MYKPSEQIKKQIAAEYWDLDLCKEGGCYESASKICQDYSISIATKWSNLPTIKTALELLETKPQWQDKPDKEGWWWYWQGDEGFCGTDIYYIHESVTGILVCDNFPLIDDLRSYNWEGIKWLYIPEPEPYKGEE
ncbi:MAG: hypothetical protein A9183_02965 [Dehalococcoides mccartyi]|uniref:hypothetical protein n=1 Tax=Dehalococcoides mccartyi TaxID=61435 RepID=UPI00080541A1|nr:hypothetical protein [Dehalococcoides mccartyi]OBW61081.1 MAG: hypothetical protein A9183_02965 [Dehalococcoides mccartyi]